MRKLWRLRETIPLPLPSSSRRLRSTLRKLEPGSNWRPSSRTMETGSMLSINIVKQRWQTPAILEQWRLGRCSRSISSSSAGRLQQYPESVQGGSRTAGQTYCVNEGRRKHSTSRKPENEPSDDERYPGDFRQTELGHASGCQGERRKTLR